MCIYNYKLMYIYIYIYMYVYIYIFIYEENFEKINSPRFDEFIMKVDVERFGCNNLLQDFRLMKKCC